MLKDNGDKISAEDKEKLEKAIEQAKKDFETDNIDELRAAIDKLSKENEAIVTKLYQASAQNAEGAAQGDSTENKDNKNDDEIIVE